MVAWVAPTRPARASYGPLSGKPRIAPAVPGDTDPASERAGASSPFTRRTATSFRGSKWIARALSLGPVPRAWTTVSSSPATTWALVTTTPGRATQPEPSTPRPHAVPSTLTTLRDARRTPGRRAIAAR